MIKLQVSEFGPIVEGTVDLKPLTSFVGPNNSGKSYVAVLAYALFRSLPPFQTLRGFRRMLHPSRRYLPLLGGTLDDDKEILGLLQKQLNKVAGESRSKEVSILFRDLPDKVKQALEKALQSSLNECAITFADELKRCFSSDILELTRKTSRRGFNISVSQKTPPLQLNMSYTDNTLKTVKSDFDVSNQYIRLRVPPPTLLRRTFTE